MGFSTNGRLSGADDVSLGNPNPLQNNDTLIYNQAIAKWVNQVAPIPTLADNTITEPKLAISNTPANGQVLGWNGSSLTWTTPFSGSGTGTGMLTVASSDSTTAVKAKADYVCTGTNDQVAINQALQAASRAADGFGGTGMGGVQLVGSTFYVGNNGTGSITMYPSTHLCGTGFGTLIIPSWPSNVDRGAIELLNPSTSNVRVSNLTIGRANATWFNGHGIKFAANGSASAYEINTGVEPYNWIDNIMILRPSRKAIWLTGTSAGSQPSQVTQIAHVAMYAPLQEGVLIDGNVDAQIVDCRATGGEIAPRYSLGGTGHVKVSNSKAFYSGNSNNSNPNLNADGFLVTSNRAELSGCAAQDNGRWGFNIAGGNANLVGCTADSNSVRQPDGGGFYIGASCSGQGLVAFDRGQTSSSTQNRGIIFGGGPQVNITGYVDKPSAPSGTVVYVGGTINVANSYLRVVKVGVGVATEGSF